MKRRDFLKGLTASALLIPATSIAKPPDQNAIQDLKDQLSQSMHQVFEPELASPESCQWPDGISDGSHCSFTQNHSF